MYLACCKILGGCTNCFETLTRNNVNDRCPHCRGPRVISNMNEVKKLDEVLTMIRAFVDGGQESPVDEGNISFLLC